MSVEYKGHILNQTEELLVDDVLKKYREEQRKLAEIKKCKLEFSFIVSDTISKIGLEETKRIIRAINQELRDLEGASEWKKI